MLRVLERERTPQAIDNIVGELATAWANEVGALPSAELLATITAIVGVVNLGGVALFNHNYGNLSATDGDVWQDPHAGGYFAAYADPESGALAFVRRLLLQSCKSLLIAADAGDVESAARELERCGGWTAPALSSDGKVFPVSLDAGPTFSDDWGAARSGGRTHQGNDIFAPTGAPVLAIEPGIAKQGENHLGGHIVTLTTSDGTRYYYAHLSAFEGDTPRTVQAGDVLGYVGTSGNAAGGASHLHFEVRPQGGDPIDPFPLLQSIRSPGAATAYTGAELRSFYRKAYPASVAISPRKLTHGSTGFGIALVGGSVAALVGLALVARRAA
jgi:murein DD-endopeptidase MepM/ murein hydrolase activator NlpD